MVDNIIKLLEKYEPNKEKQPFLWALYDGFHTFLFAPNHVTKAGVHIRDNMDLKRTMIHVVLMLQLCYLFGTYNIGHQHFLALGEYTGFLEGAHLKLMYGLWQLLPIFVVTHVVALGIEFYYASKKGHSIEEGILVSAALIPLIMPPDLPLWILAIGVAFAVIIGKEAFGGTGMNIWNVALLSRVFIFFAYPTEISGDEVWVAGLESTFAGSAVEYGWVHLTLFNGLFGWLGLAQFDPGLTVIDGFTGATPLALAFAGGWDAVTEVYSQSQMLWGAIPGSIGETSKPLILIGAIGLAMLKIASWRIMLGMVLGTVFTGMLLNFWGATPFMTVPWYHHIYIGSFLFAMAFMATDPVTAASTNRGKWIYGFLIGFFGMIIRILNPAYPEGWMLAILLMNTFSPLIDHLVLRKNIQKRLASA
ncbi:MAG: NADH:ubiquinone reductase (Na(+)-transporting) subunit B [Saprospirales bacterium]|nr:MAG: NADH:ubiquinone reductase (Na(+)-transporting) subunit B [Saprospirales bacterium]